MMLFVLINISVSYMKFPHILLTDGRHQNVTRNYQTFSITDIYLLTRTWQLSKCSHRSCLQYTHAPYIIEIHSLQNS